MKPIHLVFLTGILYSCGCAQSLLNHSAMETRVVEQFADALNEENEPALRRIASSRFEDKALRSDDVLRDLRVLHLPTGKLSVVEVKDVKKGRREVIVKEESGGKYQFHLVNDPHKKYWAVDDVVVRQRSKGTQVTKSTVEVMDLLVTLRHFLDVWKDGTREEVLAMTSPDLTAALQPLPDEWLQALTNRIASTYEEGMARKPKANLTEDEAVVKLPSKNGHLLMKIVKASDGWLVDDVEAYNRRADNHPGSIRRQADAINTVNAFLTAYAAEDHAALQLISEAKLYNESLKLADLSLVQLPKPEEVPAEFDIRAYEDRLTFMIPAGREIVRLDLKEKEKKIALSPEEAVAESSSDMRFTVKDVTLYDKVARRQKSLSAVFTAPTRAALFLKALAKRDYRILSQVSTTEFGRATWKRLTPEIMAGMQLPDLGLEQLELTDSHSIGQTTELEFRAGSGLLISCRMLNQNGALKIDDIQYPDDQGQVTSLRTRIEVSVPLLEFAAAWKANDIEMIQKACSSDFNHLVWAHLTSVPEQFRSLENSLAADITGVRVTPERATVKIGRGASGMTASLIMEHNYWVVDELRLEPSPGQFVNVRHRLRSQIAEKILSGSYSTIASEGHEVIVPVAQTPEIDETFDTAMFSSDADRPVQQASHNGSVTGEKGTVEQAVYERHLKDGADSFDGTRVTPAVRTRVLPDDRMVAGPDSSDDLRTGGVTAASFTRPAPAGPPAIDMTPTDHARQGQNATAATDDGLIHFGPATGQLKAAQPGSHVSSESTQPPRGRISVQVRQPADAPIPIH